MNRSFLRILSDYASIIVLALLCAFFSFATYGEQRFEGSEAGARIAATIRSQVGEKPKVLIVVRDSDLDRLLADRLRKEMTSSGGEVVAEVYGEPKDARAALKKIADAGRKFDVVAASYQPGQWHVLTDMTEQFPTLGEPPIVVPPSYYWPTFLKRDNLVNIADQIAIIAVLAIGMTMVIITGGIDLSVGSLIALSAVVATRLIRDWAGGTSASPAATTACCAAAVAACGLVGAFSATMITRFEIPPFIVTLGMMLVGNGLAFHISKEQTINEVPDSFAWLGRGAGLFGLPNAVLLMLVLYALAHVVMSRMRLGRYLYAVGGNREAARLSGVPVKRVVLFAYVASAMLAALGGIVMASKLTSGSPNYGVMYELYVIAAAVVGGASLAGGEGNMFRTLAGAFTIAVMQNGMNLMNIGSHTQKIVLGFVILAAVLADMVRRRA